MTALPLAISLAATLPSTGAFAQPKKPPTFPLECNTKGMKQRVRIYQFQQQRLLMGNESMQPLTIAPNSPQASNQAYILIREFERAPQSAKAKPPGPGQCAFLDRPVAANEPNILAFTNKPPEIWLELDPTTGRIKIESTTFDFDKPEPERVTYQVYQGTHVTTGKLVAFQVQ